MTMPQAAQTSRPLEQVSTQLAVQYLQPAGRGSVASHRVQSSHKVLHLATVVPGNLEKWRLQALTWAAEQPAALTA